MNRPARRDGTPENIEDIFIPQAKPAKRQHLMPDEAARVQASQGKKDEKDGLASMGFNVYDADVLQPEPVRKGGLVRPDLVSVHCMIIGKM